MELFRLRERTVQSLTREREVSEMYLLTSGMAAILGALCGRAHSYPVDGGLDHRVGAVHAEPETCLAKMGGSGAGMGSFDTLRR
jgi:hypothetical protein